MSLASIFFKNLGRSLLVTAITAIVSGLLTSFLMAIMSSIFNVNMSVLAIMIVTAILSVIALIIFYAFASQWSWFFSAEDDSCDNPPHVIVGYFLFFLIFAVFGLTSIIMLFSGYDKIVAAVAGNIRSDYNFLAILFPSVSLAQLSYFLIMSIHYGHWQTCRCGRMFCMDYSLVEMKKWDTDTYKTKTYQENVGSLEVGDQKIDVTANRTYGYIETMHHTERRLCGCCSNCGRENDRTHERIS